MAGPELAGSVTSGGREPSGAASSTPASGGRRILRTQTAGNLGESIVANEVEASNPHVAYLWVIDVDYCGLVGVMLFNQSEVDFIMKPGDHTAQMIVQVIATLEVAEVEDLDATVRREGVFGSTDV
ncbi:deoxyuridine 5'-triphosphate nucleotidohydrolase-like [Triticum aestivum]|uniref:deoxyuridine 5'-triphosphate nucleotidohydrolase-like n=1 Tax=Triticum aestivum TaxID=4565 RepID=UPI001D02E087|nr:deoxyuridine 5'-triphosphate nucleotidohydrolase-like [Triticum aestivum]